MRVQCGATTADATWVLAGESGQAALDEKRNRVAVVEGDANVRFVDATHLPVTYSAELFDARNSQGRLSIVYRMDPGK
jgi:hypothetical protein